MPGGTGQGSSRTSSKNLCDCEQAPASSQAQVCPCTAKVMPRPPPRETEGFYLPGKSVCGDPHPQFELMVLGGGPWGGAESRGKGALSNGIGALRIIIIIIK